MSGWWAVSGLLGVAVGLWFRVYAALAATVLVATLAIGTSLMAGESLGMTVTRSVGAIACLQAGYIVGLLISTGRRRYARRPTRR